MLGSPVFGNPHIDDSLFLLDQGGPRILAAHCPLLLHNHDMGVSENRGPEYSTLNGRILVIRTPK